MTDKKVRNAVRCFLIENKKVVCIEYKKKRTGYFDLPGGKIEENETKEAAVIREFKEETGLDIKDPILRGVMYLNYPEKSFAFHTYIVKRYKGEIKEFDENYTYWLPIDEFINNKKRFVNTILLEPSFLNILTDEEKEFIITIDADKNENILNLELSVQNKV